MACYRHNAVPRSVQPCQARRRSVRWSGSRCRAGSDAVPSHSFGRLSFGSERNSAVESTSARVGYLAISKLIRDSSCCSSSIGRCFCLSATRTIQSVLFIYHAGLCNSPVLPVPLYPVIAPPEDPETGEHRQSDRGLSSGLAQGPVTQDRCFCRAC